jgi:hypothetical protein
MTAHIFRTPQVEPDLAERADYIAAVVLKNTPYSVPKDSRSGKNIWPTPRVAKKDNYYRQATWKNLNQGGNWGEQI